MGEAVGEVLAFGAGVAMSPLAVAAVVVLLVAPGGARRAWVATGAWVLALVAVCAAALLAADAADASDDGAPATWASVAKLLVAAVLVAVAVRQWRGRDPGPGADPPAWLRKLDGIGVAGAAGIGVLFAVKPKNLLLAVGAGIAIAQVGASPGAQAVALVVFVVVASIGLLVPLAISALAPGRGPDLLSGWRDWLVRENATVVAVICLLIAAKLAGDAMVSLVG